MTPADFDDQFNRLTNHFRMSADTDRHLVALEWLKAVEHYHIDALDHAVTELIRHSTDTFWPPLGKLLEIIRNRIAGLERVSNKCQTCNGSTWVEAWPWQVNGLVYTGMSRCPDCGVPAPQDIKQSSHRVPLTKVQYQQYLAGEYGRNVIEGAKRPNHKNPEMQQLIAAFSAKFLKRGEVA
jgi:hypothetical protein